MPNRKQQPEFSNDADIIILDEKDGVKDTTRRPLTGERLRRAQDYVARMKEFERMAEEHAKKNRATGKSSEPADEVTELK